MLVTNLAPPLFHPLPTITTPPPALTPVINHNSGTRSNANFKDSLWTAYHSRKIRVTARSVRNTLTEPELFHSDVFPEQLVAVVVSLDVCAGRNYADGPSVSRCYFKLRSPTGIISLRSDLRPLIYYRSCTQEEGEKRLVL